MPRGWAPVLAHVPSFGQNPRGSPAYPVPEACMHVLSTGIPRCLGVARSASSPKAPQALGCCSADLRLSIDQKKWFLDRGLHIALRCSPCRQNSKGHTHEDTQAPAARPRPRFVPNKSHPILLQNNGVRERVPWFNPTCARATFDVRRTEFPSGTPFCLSLSSSVYLTAIFSRFTPICVF